MRRVAVLVAAMGCGAGVSHDPQGQDHTVLVLAGPFEMGCHQATDPACTTADELPYHQVTVSAFRIDETEVTQAAYALCVNDGVCTAPATNFDPNNRADFPVTNVSWFQAASYCAWASMRLPTEAEWEKAARGTDDRTYPWGSESPTCALTNFDGCGDAVQPVGMHPAGASPYGALDMAGNVVEWVADSYAADYYAASPTTDPAGPASGTNRVKRGGDYTRRASDLRVSRRAAPPPGDAEDEKGFRCARSGS